MKCLANLDCLQIGFEAKLIAVLPMWFLDSLSDRPLWASGGSAFNHRHVLLRAGSGLSHAVTTGSNRSKTSFRIERSSH